MDGDKSALVVILFWTFYVAVPIGIVASAIYALFKRKTPKK